MEICSFSESNRYFSPEDEVERGVDGFDEGTEDEKGRGKIAGVCRFGVECRGKLAGYAFPSDPNEDQYSS